MRMHSWSKALALTAALGIGMGPALGQTNDPANALILPRTEKSGPAERVVDFVIAPGAPTARLSDAAVAQVAANLGAAGAQARQAAELELGIQAVGDATGVLGALATVPEHALFLEEFAPVNNALTNIGGILALAQVSRDIWNGKIDSALAGTIKGWMSFAISKWGWGPLQIGGIALFVVDITLREWQAGVSQIAADGLWCHYIAWYRENGRTVGDWKARAWELFLLAEREGRGGFPDYLDIELNRFVNLALQDPMWITYGSCSTSTMGLGHAGIEDMLTTEYKLALSQMLADEVLPEIGNRAWQRNLAAQVAWANTHLLPRLNKTLTLEITAYGYPDGTRVVMPLPAGGEWAGKLRPEGTFRAEVTRFAIAKAGFPETVQLHSPSGVEERRLTLSDGRLTAMFGAPETPLVSRYALTEQGGTCTVTRIAADGSRTTETTAADARAGQDVDFAMLPNGGWVMGRFDPLSGWQTASPGTTTGDRIDFGAPLWDGITTFRACDISFLADDTLASSACTVERFDAKQVSTAVRMERRCTAPARLQISGVYTAMMGGEMTYYPLDGPEGQMIVDMMKRGMQEGVVGGLPGLPDMPTGIPDLPGGN